MEKETKKCPYCGEEILTVAKKCRYCGEWLEEKPPIAKKMITCPVCAEQVEEGAAVCPYCHEPLTSEVQKEGNRPMPHRVVEEQESADELSWKESSFLSHYFTEVVTRHYADFKGVATRKQYWLYTLFYSIILVALSCIDLLLGIDFKLFEESFGYGWLFALASLALCVPSLAIAVRRLHDTGKNGWWLLIALVPIVGVIWLLCLLCKKGNATNPSIPLTSTDKTTLGLLIVTVAALFVFAGLKPFGHFQTSQSSNDNMYFDGDTMGVDILDDAGYLTDEQDINNESYVEIKRQIIHDFSCFFAIYHFCDAMKTAISKWHNGDWGEYNLPLISDAEYQWLIKQFDFSNFSRLLRAYAVNSDGNYREDYGDIIENDLVRKAVECLEKREVVLSPQWFDSFNKFLIYDPMQNVQVVEFHDLGNKTYQVRFDTHLNPYSVYNISYANGLTIVAH